ncbi:MAG: flagellar export chaperone FlgN [Oscillospiraceae bacterium]|nr:flagellar export chaperone FlgN [Oscillospiraceae bacterium]
MDRRTADAVVKCLEIDVDFYRELTVFLMKKHTKIMQDDLEWLTDSLNDEQAYLMKSRSLEDKRLALFKGLGIADKKVSELAADAPEDYRPKIKMLAGQLTELVNNIAEINAETTEIVKRKLDSEKAIVDQTGIVNKPETYNRHASKVAGGQSAAKAFRNI